MDKIASSSSTKKPYKSWSKTTRSNDWTKELRVEEIENGFIVCLNEYGQKNGKYSDESKKYYSKDNPLSEDDLELDNGLDKAIEDFINNM